MADEKINEAVEDAEPQGQFAIQKIYIKDVSLESPHTPHIFKAQWNPSVNMDLANSVDDLGEDMYEVALSVTVTVSDDKKTVYLVEVKQAGIFLITAFSRDVIARMVATLCPNILFPFAREAVADLITRAGFPQLLLAPVNFDALYVQQQQAATQKEMKH